MGKEKGIDERKRNDQFINYQGYWWWIVGEEDEKDVQKIKKLW
jgi:hypothetical protein